MKPYSILLFLLLITAATTNAQFITANVKVAGLTCSMCSNVTEKSLKTLDFVDSISTDLNTATFTLHFKKNTPIVIDMIAKKVEDAGFSVSALTATFNFNAVSISKNLHWPYENSVYHFVTGANKTLSGVQKLRFIDKNFITKSEFKKHTKEINSECYHAGASCDKCQDAGKVRVYHVQLIEA